MNAAIAVILIGLSGDVKTNPGPQFDIKECRTRGLKVCHLNARICYQKLILINRSPFDVIAISETWLKSTVTNAEINFTNYSITRHDRIDKTGGDCDLRS